MPAPDPAVASLGVSAYTVPTEAPEADGTLAWDRTTVVFVQADAGGERGIGATYATAACVPLIRDVLAPAVTGRPALDVPGSWTAMVRAVRNLGRPGIASTAIAAVDLALWDLKARLLDLPLCRLLGMARDTVPVYGSGGFPTYDDPTLAAQVAGWVHGDGIPAVKIKVAEDRGRRPDRDVQRVEVARRAAGPSAEVYVDANGGYTAKAAVRLARRFAACGVRWFEEPVSSDDLAGLAQVRAATDLDVTAGEYGYDLAYFARMCAAGAVDCLQADVTRCAGITEWLRAATVAAAHGLEVSAHCAPAWHLHAALAVPNVRHLEWFFDHVRLEQLLFEGAPRVDRGLLRPDLTVAGHGLHLRHVDAERWRVA